MKYSTWLFGKNCLNSEYNWAASVLLWVIIRVGFWVASITFAIVYVFPDPVTPKRVLYWFPAFIESLKAFIATGWSPAGS